MNGSHVGALLTLYALVQALGFAARPLAARLLPNLADRGYGASRLLGLLLYGYLFWMLYALGLVANDRQGAWMAAAVYALLCATAARGVRLAGRSGSRPAWMQTELLFVGATLAWAFFRSAEPSVAHTEQPMDLMMMNALWTSPDFPPQDAWLSGTPIGYYHFGYWLLTALGRLIEQPPELLYNTGQSVWFALLLSSLFALAINLLRSGQGARPIGRAALLGGWLAVAVIGLGSNLRGAIDVFTPTAETFWWWPASRPFYDILPDGTSVDLIVEFPFFSYLIADNHPHVLAMPFAILALSLALNLWHRPRVELPRRPRFSPGDGLNLLAISLAAGALLFLNAWDYPAMWLVLAVAAYRRFRWTPALFMAVGAGTLCSFLLYAPYHLFAQSQVLGVTMNTFLHFNPLKLPAVFGLLMPGLILLGLQGLDVRREPPRDRDSLIFMLLIAATGLLLVAIPEAVFIKDLFGHRMNTVFKFYYQAWLLLGLGAACAVARAVERRQYPFMTGLALLAAGAGLIYPARVLLESPLSLSGRNLSVLSQIEMSAPGEAEALRWIMAHTPADAVVAEAPGASYLPMYNRVSTFTGRRALMGWTSHEVQWRGKRYAALAAGREAALRTVYTSGQATALQTVARRWGIDYVYLGPTERLVYNIRPDMEERISALIRPVFSNEAVRIYRFRKDRRPPP